MPSEDEKLPVGLYDRLRTKQLEELLRQGDSFDRAEWAAFGEEELHQRLIKPLAIEIATQVVNALAGSRKGAFAQRLEQIFTSETLLQEALAAVRPTRPETLHQIRPPAPRVPVEVRPATPLSSSALLTGSSRSPALRSELIKELASCDRADWLVSFIKVSGIVPLLPALRALAELGPLPDGGPRLRIATTSYLGATDQQAVQRLLELPNTEIRISYDTRRTRLHAKAYLFHRKSGFGSAYVGSANISRAALDEGLEWTAKISQYETEHLWAHAVATFESHWQDDNEFAPCHAEDLPKLRQALEQERGGGRSDSEMTFFDLCPYGYQQAILDDILAERAAGKHKHLVIAATGTGKTMIAAFDYRRFCSDRRGRPSLLFLAHRKEILDQARASFCQVLRDGSFGTVIAAGSDMPQDRHLFCTVQSWSSRGFDGFPPDHFEYVVLDEAHHAQAESYQRLITHLRPRVLLGLTATPERGDGKDIRSDFDDTFTHEIRLPDAIERALLCPFHYFGIPDLEGIDFSRMAWRAGGYDNKQIGELLSGNRRRAEWVLSQAALHVADLNQVSGLGFCVSVEHAHFMANYFNEQGVSAIALTGEAPSSEREQAKQRLESGGLALIFTVDLYNEGVDIPQIDLVIFLRPTESLTIFLQQLGRGLRLYSEKSHLTVLDFIAPQHRQFSFARRFRALSSQPLMRIDRQIEGGMPYVPAGCLIHLEPRAKEHVLNNIKAAAKDVQRKQIITHLRQLEHEVDGEVGLEEILDYLHLDDPDDLYRRGLPHQLLHQARTGEVGDSLAGYGDMLAKGFRRLLLSDDTLLINGGKQMLEGRDAMSFS